MSGRIDLSRMGISRKCGLDTCKRLLAGILTGLTLNFAAVEHSDAQAIDYDRDGLSDLVTVRINNDQSLSWYTLLSSNGKVEGLSKVGLVGQHLIPGAWTGDPTPQIGTVGLDRGNNINWQILDSQGNVQSRQFGSNGGTAISGADFNGNGVFDAALVVNSGKKTTWRIKPDLFTSDAAVQEIRFGRASDKVLYLNVDGSKDWIGTLQATRGRNSLLRIRNVASGRMRTFSRLPALAAKPNTRPHPLKSPSGGDVIALVSKSGDKTRVFFYSLNGKKLPKAVFEGDGEFLVGNFLAAAGEEVAWSTSSGLTVYNPFAKEQAVLPGLEGIPTDLFNINVLNRSGGEGPSSVQSCQSIRSWPDTHIYKTIGSTHFTDIRRNTAGLIVEPGGAGPFPDCISIVDGAGNVLAEMGLYARGNGWAARYYAGIGCGSDTAFNGATLAAKARANTGSTNIYANFGPVCSGPIAADRCIGSSQC